jgi:hypothetical protein
VATQRYFQPRYFAAGYFNPSYFAVQTPLSVGGYFANGYFATGYFANHYFASATARPAQHYFAAKYYANGYFAAGYIGGGPAIAGHATGSIALSLGGVSSALSGSFFKATFTGTIAVGLDGVGANLLANTAQRESFDLSVSVTPTWHFTEYPGFAGIASSTLDDVGGSFVGTFRAVGAIDGAMVTGLDGAFGEFDGTHVRPVGRTGLASGTLDDLVATNWVGSFAAHGTRFGQLAAELDGLTAQLLGTQSIPNRTGAVTAQLDDLGGAIIGLSLLSGARLGAMTLTLDDLGCDMVGLGPKFKKASPKRTINPRGTARRVIKVRKVR